MEFVTGFLLILVVVLIFVALMLSSEIKYLKIERDQIYKNYTEVYNLYCEFLFKHTKES